MVNLWYVFLAVILMEVVTLVIRYIYNFKIEPRLIEVEVLKSRKIYETLNRIVRSTSCMRACVLMCDDVGKNTVSEQKYESSILFESCNGDVHSIINNWSKIILDKTYVRLIRVLKEKKFLIIDTKNRELINGKLRNVLEANDVSECVVVELKTNKGKYFYMTFDFKEKASNYDHMVMQGEIDIIKNLI